jgi:hypothetical protein
MLNAEYHGIVIKISGEKQVEILSALFLQSLKRKTAI